VACEFLLPVVSWAVHEPLRAHHIPLAVPLGVNGAASATFGDMTFFGGVDGVKEGESTLNFPRPWLFIAHPRLVKTVLWAQSSDTKPIISIRALLWRLLGVRVVIERAACRFPIVRRRSFSL
jgi:hypothetical protein